MINILIVDDHPIVADGLKRLVTDKGISAKCFVVHTCAECIRSLPIVHPELVLLDYSLPDGNGIDLCKHILAFDSKIKVLGISSFKEQSIVNKLIELGASGYVLKNASDDEIYTAITKVLNGEKYICDSTLEALQEQETKAILTRREVEVLKYIADGFTNPEIGEKLFISPLTVDSHRKNLILKLNAKNTASLIKIALQNGFI